MTNSIHWLVTISFYIACSRILYRGGYNFGRLQLWTRNLISGTIKPSETQSLTSHFLSRRLRDGVLLGHLDEFIQPLDRPKVYLFLLLMQRIRHSDIYFNLFSF